MTRPTAQVALRLTAAVFVAAVVVHGADHVRRGVDVVTAHVFWAGTLQLVLAVVVVALVFGEHPLAPPAAAALGFASAAGFAAAHLLPQWSAFSDPFTGSQVAPQVSALSWATAVVEIAADLAFGAAGVAAMRPRTRPRTAAG